MKAENNKMVAVDYTLTVDGKIADRSRPGQPLEFIFGTGMLLPKFEAAIVGKEPGEKVSFTLAPADGYGEIVDDAIVDLPKTIFMVDGKLAEDILFVGSQIPMANAQGQRMLGVVKEIGDDTVKMDFNHPMAGKTLNFDVEVISVRDVTPEDLANAAAGSAVAATTATAKASRTPTAAATAATDRHPNAKAGPQAGFFYRRGDPMIHHLRPCSSPSPITSNRFSTPAA